MFLSGAYFQGELYLPNLKRSEGVGVAAMLEAANGNSLEWFIAKYEREYLERALGKMLCDNFFHGWQATPVDNLWTELHACIFPDSKPLMSPAANYVYYWIVRWRRTKTTMNGEVIGGDVSRVTSSEDKLIKVWNDLCRETERVRAFAQGEHYRKYADETLCQYPFIPINKFNL